MFYITFMISNYFLVIANLHKFQITFYFLIFLSF